MVEKQDLDKIQDDGVYKGIEVCILKMLWAIGLILLDIRRLMMDKQAQYQEPEAVQKRGKK